MIPYIIIFLVTALNCFINNRKSNNCIILLLFLLSALRYNVGYDYESYLHIMQSNDMFLINRMELFERFLLIKSIELKFYQLFFIVNSFIVCLCIYKFINRFSINQALSYLVFLCVPLMLTQSFSIIRHWTAVAIILYGTTFLIDRKIITFLLCVAIAYFCHSVALVGLLFIPLFYIHINLTINLVMLVSAFLLGSLLQRFLTDFNGVGIKDVEEFIRYAQGEGEGGLTKLPYIFLAIDILLLSKLRKNVNLWRWVCIFNFGVCLMFLFSFQSTLSLRFSTIFLPAVIICLPCFVGQKLSENNTANSTIFILVMGILFFLNISIYNQTILRSQYLPYEFFFL